MKNGYFLKWLAEKIKKDWGERCDDYEPLCPLCQAWKNYDKIKKLLSK